MRNANICLEIQEDEKRPDPAVDLVGALRWMMERIEALEAHVLENGERRIPASRVAVSMGFSVHYLSPPWRIPAFGAQGTRHTAKEWRKWLARPEAERRAEWEAMSLKDRRIARGVS